MTDSIDLLAAALKGRYDIERELGAGGMATVYLAHDVRHDRKVALKVLRPELSAILGAERFVNEIRTTANLQHPNILPLHDSGEVDGLVFYVMPYVEGESLRDRLERERPLPVDEAVEIATEIASALDYAHRHGVIHRDIKPENILLHDGRALVADFGIALAASRTDGATRLTETGLSLGTPAYMSPEQAMGERQITAKADVYALGCVLYEMLVGEPPFTGPNAQAVIARVMTDAPRGLTAQRHTVPPSLENAVLKALEKLPADRFATAKEFADAVTGAVPVEGAPMRAPARVTWRSALRHPLTLGFAALAVLGFGLAAALWHAGTRGATGETVRFTISAPPGRAWDLSLGSPFAVSPDGKVLVYAAAARDSDTHLYARPLDQLEANAIPGTAGAHNPFFSPDGGWVGFATSTALERVPLTGGAPITVAPLSGQFGGASWLSDGRIIFSAGGEVLVVAATGGTPRPLAPSDTARARVLKLYPLVVPGERSIIFTRWSGAAITSKLVLMSLDGAPWRDLGIAGSDPLAVLDGYLVYSSAAGAIMAVRLDAHAGRIDGSSVPLVSGAQSDLGGALKGGISRSGTLVYAPASQHEAMVIAEPGRPLRTLIPDVNHPSYPRFSPDGRHLVLTVYGDAGPDIWVFDLPNGPFRRLTSGETNDRPEWMPDSRNVVFRSTRDPRASSLWIQPEDGSAPAREFFSLPAAGVYEGVVSHDGTYLLYQRDSTGVAGRVWYRRLHGDTTPHVVAAASAGQQTAGRLSPDDRWVAYQSDESGTMQVYVKPFPALDRRYQVSLDGGGQPVWSHDGRRLYYVSADQILAATLQFTPTLGVTARDTVVARGVDPGFGYHAGFDVTPDGKGVVYIEAAGSHGDVIVVHDWLHELKARLAGEQ